MPMPESPAVEVLSKKMRQHSILSERLSDLQDDIVELVEKIARTPPRDNLAPAIEPVPQKRHGACDLQVWEDDNGQWSFSFDLQERFPLQARLAKALIFLATEAGDDSSGDGLLGFRTRADLLAHLQKTAKPGKVILRRYVNNVTGLLRAALIKHTGRDLIGANDEWGVRLLLKRGGLHGLESTSARKWL